MGIFEYEIQKRSSSKKVCEDELTSRVFGILEIAGKDILSKWLKIDGISNIEYWPKFKGVEPEILLYDSKDNAIFIENKYEDEGSVGQLVKEYNLASEQYKGRLVFITAHISRPTIIGEAEKELHLKEGTIEWTNWYSLYSIIKNEDESDNIEPFEKQLLEQLKIFLEWRKMGLRLGDMMKDYNNIYKENKWLEILSEQFHDFLAEVRREFQSKLKLHEDIRVSDSVKSDLFYRSWIHLNSKRVEEVNDKIYYCVLFDMLDYSWKIFLEGKNKDIRRDVREYLISINKSGINITDNIPGYDHIAYSIIRKNPDYSNPSTLKDEIIDNSLAFIEKIDSILLSAKGNNDL